MICRQGSSESRNTLNGRAEIKMDSGFFFTRQFASVVNVFLIPHKNNKYSLI